jgi:tetratricopeptide (TPR) repeat protein
MGHLSRNILTLPMAVLMLLMSCMSLKNAGTREVDETRIKSQEYIAAGDYKRALDVCCDACRTYSTDERLLTNYRRTKETIHRTAREAFGREDFALSGQAYYALANDNSYCRQLLHEPSHEKEFIKRLKESSDHLFQYALAEYRKGNLAEAISLWRNILVFDPNNPAVVKAIDKTTIQLKNLQP